MADNSVNSKENESEIIKRAENNILCAGCSQRKKNRTEKEYRTMMNRLKRIEGQVRGLERLLEEDTYCPDILTQVMAVNSALNSFSKELLANHIRSCVADDIRRGNEDTIEELVTVLQKLMK